MSSQLESTAARSGLETRGPDRPIFIVGPSRSGTALVRAMVNRLPDVGLAGETHYFDDLRPKLRHPRVGPLSHEERARCEDYFLALTHRPYGHGGDSSSGWLSRADLERSAQAIGPGGDAYFEAFCRLVAARAGATRWGEKTPRHVFRLREILECYPRARVVCMMRDPRAVVASYRDWIVDQGGLGPIDEVDHEVAIANEAERTRRSYDLLLTSLLWRSQARAMIDARARFGRSVRIQRFESLVSRPEEEAAELADFLGASFDPSMLHVPQLNSSFDRFTPEAGVATAPLTRWRSLLSPVEVAVVQQTCGSLMSDFAYERLPTPASSVALAGFWLRLPVAVARAAFANRARLGNPVSYAWNRLRPLGPSRG